MLSYLNALPQEERIVHVAGTNGKGSVCSFLDAVLQKAGKRTARFTSPHLVRVTERFSFDGQEADDALFLEAFEVVKASYVHFEQEGLGHPTYFEYLFLMFMWMVRRKKPEYVILETGLGGRLDATNCIEHPALTVITSISLDHMEYLGGTVTQIAGEKAGILKKICRWCTMIRMRRLRLLSEIGRRNFPVRHIRSARQCIRIFGGNMAG